MLTRAKLHAPRCEQTWTSQLARLSSLLKARSETQASNTPDWIRAFFNETTLCETEALFNETIKRRYYFVLGCLLGILHHQRPGFLSFPSSHLVPYLRDNVFPRNEYPELYGYRDPIPRLEAKIRRILSVPPPILNAKYKVLQKSALKKYLPPCSVDTIITSPPYMSALDYARDNRLRLWFLGVEDFRSIKCQEIGNIKSFRLEMEAALGQMRDALKPGCNCVLILGDVTFSKKEYDVPMMIIDAMHTINSTMVLEKKWTDVIPDKRRSRRNGRATRHETIMVFRKKRRM